MLATSLINLLKRDSKTEFFLACKIFKNKLFYRTSLVGASDSFRFPVCNLFKKEAPLKIFFCDFYKILKKIISFVRTPPDDCFLCLSVKFEEIFRTPIL